MSRAPTDRGIGHGGRAVRVCRACGKTAFENEEQAVAGVRAALLSGYLLLRPYEGPCGWWHLTKQLDGRGKRGAA